MKPKRPNQQNFIHIKELIDQILANCRVTDNSDFIKIVKIWERHFGPEITRYAQPASFKNGLLWIHVKSSTLFHQLRFMANDIKTILNQALDDATVVNVKFKIK